MKRKLIMLVVILLICTLLLSKKTKLYYYQMCYTDKLPDQSWGEVEVYRSDDNYIVLTIDYTGKVMKAVEYSAERELVGAINVRVITIDSIESYLHKPWEEVQRALGEMHVDTGNGFEYPSYFSRDGFLICFSLTLYHGYLSLSFVVQPAATTPVIP